MFFSLTLREACYSIAFLAGMRQPWIDIFRLDHTCQPGEPVMNAKKDPKQIIKRYPNRKLYDSRSKRFVKLGDIAYRVRQGEEIQVVDNVSGEDITVSILEQIIFQQESRNWRAIPEYARALHDSIRIGGGVMTSFLRKTILSGLGAFLVTKESVEKLVDELTRRGELSREEAPGFLKDMLNRAEQNSRKIEEEIRKRVDKTVHSLFPHLHRLDEINARLETLAAEVEALKKARITADEAQKDKVSRKKSVSARTKKTQKK